VRSPCSRFCLSGALALCVGRLRALAEVHVVRAGAIALCALSRGDRRE
jgi:hypothetical protein